MKLRVVPSLLIALLVCVTGDSIMRFVSKCVSVLLLLGMPTVCNSQQQFNTWFFGEHAGISFEIPSPKILSAGATNDWEGICCISDARNGESLFHSNGETVWNRRNEPMPNGTGLFGNTSSEQSAVVLRSLVDSSIYYLFTVDQAGYFWPSRGLNYSIIDMRLDAGYGDVLCKNVHLLDDAAEALQAVPREDGGGYWVIVHKLGSNQFCSYSLSDTGVSEIPVVSSIGSSIGTGDDGICGIASCADGKVISLSATNLRMLQLFKFDASDGTVSSAVDLSGYASMENYLGAFSPSGRYYYSYMNRGDSVLAQFDLTDWQTGSIRQSLKMLSATGRSIRNSPGALMVGPDGKIYTTNGRSKWLSVIENPERSGPDASFVVEAIDLSPGVGLSGLPNVPSSLLNKPWVVSRSRRIQIVGIAADTVGGSYYLSIKLSHHTHLSVHWNTGDLSFAEAFSHELKPLAYTANPRKNGISISVDEANPVDTIILRFDARALVPSVTFIMDSVTTTIVRDCLELHDSSSLSYSPECGRRLISSFLQGNLEITRIEAVTTVDPMVTIFHIVKVPDLPIRFKLFDELGRCKESGETRGDFVYLKTRMEAGCLCFLQVIGSNGQVICHKFLK